MLPGIDLRLQNLMKALQEVILPAIPEQERLARDQAQLVIGHLSMIALQWKSAARFEAGSLHTLCGLARNLAAIDGDAVPPGLRAQLQALLAQADAADLVDLQAVEGIIVALGSLIDEVIQQDDSTAPMDPAVMRAVLRYGAIQARRERAWFAANGLDPDRKELPTIADMLAGDLAMAGGGTPPL